MGVLDGETHRGRPESVGGEELHRRDRFARRAVHRDFVGPLEHLPEVDPAPSFQTTGTVIHGERGRDPGRLRRGRSIRSFRRLRGSRPSPSAYASNSSCKSRSPPGTLPPDKVHAGEFTPIRQRPSSLFCNRRLSVPTERIEIPAMSRRSPSPPFLARRHRARRQRNAMSALLPPLASGSEEIGRIASEIGQKSMTKKCQPIAQNQPRFIRGAIRALGTRPGTRNASLLDTEFPPSLLAVRRWNISLAGAAASLLDSPAAQQDLPTCEVAQRAIAGVLAC